MYTTLQKNVLLSTILCLLCLHGNIFLQEPDTTEKNNIKKYIPKKFDFSPLTFLSEQQKQEHYVLYTKYVEKLNEIRSKLPQAQRAPGPTYSEFRSLKIAETFALNGALLHELYFENIIGKKNKKINSNLKRLILENFDSIEEYLKDLKDCAACTRGWAITGFSLHENAIYNFVLDAHNETVPAMTIPLVVIDAYEHAYMIDFGIDRATYLNEVFAHLQWDIIEKRISNYSRLTISLKD
ncbi:MAG: Fe-Mn family superoxide dismutase [Candidatus Babeliaceae bacterium]|jgi:Fe-Mn family superoxide dismutase